MRLTRTCRWLLGAWAMTMVLLALGGCGSGSNNGATASIAKPITGKWTLLLGTTGGTQDITLTQVGTVITGTAGLTQGVPNVLKGTVTGNKISIGMSSTALAKDAELFRLNGTVSPDGNTMAGTVTFSAQMQQMLQAYAQSQAIPSAWSAKRK